MIPEAVKHLDKKLRSDELYERLSVCNDLHTATEAAPDVSLVAKVNGESIELSAIPPDYAKQVTLKALANQTKPIIRELAALHVDPPANEELPVT